jgi:type IV pilus assembly protein PilA
LATELKSQAIRERFSLSLISNRFNTESSTCFNQAVRGQERQARLLMHSKENIQRRTHAGFSLIELLIVVTIIGIIASIAIPNLLASRRAANEGSAQQSMRTIASCEITYLHTQGGGNNYADLPALGAQTLTDTNLSSGTKSGYTFVATPENGSSPQYWAYAIPTTATGFRSTGTRRFALTEDGVMRVDSTLSAPADENAVKLMSPNGN